MSLCSLFSSPARSERNLDLSFWSADQSTLALGGLWDFHAQQLVEPELGHCSSEILLEISRPWRDFQAITPQEQKPLERGSYVLLLKGLLARKEGYAIRVASPSSMTRVIAAPKYAPERRRQVESPAYFTIFEALRPLFGAELNLLFFPVAADEIWMIIVQRWRMPLDATGAVPRLQIAQLGD